MPLTLEFDPAAIASDVPRSRSQWAARSLARLVVRLAGLNRDGFLATEVAQAIVPVSRISTAHGTLVCRAGHGRLRWRARTFHTEEPETIRWLDGLGDGDVLWDIGANVGLYAIYAARFRGCRVLAFEPESQNFALLVENVALNGVGERCTPAFVAVAGRSGFGELRSRYLTKGGAYNHFNGGIAEEPEPLPESFGAVAADAGAIRHLAYGATVDDLVHQHGFPAPTHLKIDVDGLEPDIIKGAGKVLAHGPTRGILVEINRRSARDLAIPGLLEGLGFRLISERSNWLSRRDRSRESDVPTTNMIFERDGGGS